MVRNRNGTWWFAAIEPAGNPPSDTDPLQKAKQKAKRKPVLALPKGLVDPGEKAAETALREVYEETGIVADIVTKLADIKYIYTRAWGDGQRVFKIVSFYLMKYRSGRINEITSEMRIEVAEARWVALEQGPSLLAYKGEKQMVQRALEYVKAHPEL